MIYIGLDGEMSSANIDEGSALIQIGFAIIRDDGIQSFSSTMNPIGPFYWSEQAFGVHKITKEEIHLAPSRYEIDELAYQWLVNKGLNPDKRIKSVPVGFNVSGFDIPFVRKFMPKTNTLFSRRTADLNAICFALDGKDGWSSDAWKKRAKKYALEQMLEPYGNNAHNAGWDAIMHIKCFEYLQAVIKGDMK
jgi:hypothetical protein